MRQPIRVLQVIGSMNRGGAETMIMNLYRQIDKSKVQFDFMVHTNQKGAYDDEIIKLGGKIYNVPRFKGTNIWTYIKSWKLFFDNHKEYKIIHGHIGSCASIYLGIAKRYGLFTIAHSHNTKSLGKGFKNKLYPLFVYPTRHIADFFFGCSKIAGIDRYGQKVVNSDRFAILKNAIFTESFIYSNVIRKKLRKQLNIEDKFVLGHVGRFSPQKNHQILVDIFKAVHDKNENTVLLLVGDGELRKSMENKVEKLGLLNNVIFAGVRTDIPQLMQAMDVFIFPSLYEGLGMVAIEAQAAGLPCIVADTIPKEAYITDLIKCISLKESVDIWAEAILKYDNGYNRRNSYKEVMDRGYDIIDTAKWLENFYQIRWGNNYGRKKSNNRFHTYV